MRLFLNVFTLAFCFLSAALAAFVSESCDARAEVFVWKDPVHDVSIVYPHDWRPQFIERDKRGAGLRLSVLAPQGQDWASCHFSAREDARYAMYPPQYAVRVNSLVFDQNGLYDILVEHDSVRLVSRSDTAKIGSAPAVFARAEYSKRHMRIKQPMRALLFATVHKGQKFIFHCEAVSRNWAYWEPQFMAILKSVNFPKADMSYPYGYYRDFLKDEKVYLSVDNASTGMVSY